MMNYTNPQVKYSNISNPKNGYERIIEDRDNIKHLQILCMVAGDIALNAENPQIRSVERDSYYY